MEYFGPKLTCDRDSVRFVPVDVGDGRGAESAREGNGVNADRAGATDHEHLGSGRFAQSRSDRAVGVGEIVARRRSCTCAHPVRERDEGMVCPGNADSVREQATEVAAERQSVHRVTRCALAVSCPPGGTSRTGTATDVPRYDDQLTRRNAE